MNRFGSVMSLWAVGAALGCGSDQSVTNPNTVTATTTATLVPGGASTVYALVGNATPVVLGYSTAAGANPIPTISFNVSATALVEAVGVDKTSGTTYVAVYSNTDLQPEIYAYSSTASGNATPTRTILMGATTTTYPYDMTVDASGNVYVLTFDTNSGLASVVEYGPTATGTATPLRTISGSSTGIVNPVAVAVDTAGTVYVSSYTGYNVLSGSILEFSSTATGNVAPLRTITAQSSYFSGLATDASLNLYAVQEQDGAAVYSVNPRIVEFAAGASGAAAPVKSLTSPAMTYLYDLQLDSVGNLYVLNATTTGGNLLEFGPTSGSAVNANPGVTVSPTALNANTTTSIAIR